MAALLGRVWLPARPPALTPALGGRLRWLTEPEDCSGLEGVCGAGERPALQRRLPLGGPGCDAAHLGGRQRDWQGVWGLLSAGRLPDPVRLREGRLHLSGVCLCAQAAGTVPGTCSGLGLPPPRSLPRFWPEQYWGGLLPFPGLRPVNTTPGVKEPEGRVLTKDRVLGLLPGWGMAGALAPRSFLERPRLQVGRAGTKSPKKGSEQQSQEKKDAGR